MRSIFSLNNKNLQLLFFGVLFWKSITVDGPRRAINRLQYLSHLYCNVAILPVGIKDIPFSPRFSSSDTINTSYSLYSLDYTGTIFYRDASFALLHFVNQIMVEFY